MVFHSLCVGGSWRAWGRAGLCAPRAPLGWAFLDYTKALFRAVRRASACWADVLSLNDAPCNCQARTHEFEARPGRQPLAECSRARACEQLRSDARATHLRVGEHGGPQERKSCKRKATSRHHDFQCTISPPTRGRTSPFSTCHFARHLNLKLL